MKKLFFALFLALTITSCTSDGDFEKGKQQLEYMGYTDVERDGYAAWCCSEDDDYKTGFKAKDKNGKEVKGCFCSALLKGVTIRWK